MRDSKTKETGPAAYLIGVSFLLCTYNGAPRLAETLSRLAQQHTLPETRWEIIFVDNASTDNTAEVAQQLWQELGAPAPLRLVHEPRPGKQYALETAISHVQHRYTCIVDDDNRLALDYLSVGLELLEVHPQIGILGGPNTATFEGPAPAWFASFQHCYAVGPQLDRVGGGFAPLADGNVGRNVLWGAGMFVQTALWQQLRELHFQSLFSGRQGEANLTAGEDDELCYAAHLLGYEVWYSSRLHLQHHMAAGRLTTTYRDRLFYDSARTAARLNAYRNALWGKTNASVSTNLHKDNGYLVIGFFKKLFSPSFIKSYFTGDYSMRMNQWHTLKSATDTLRNYKLAKEHYQEVLAFKQRILLAQQEK